MKNIVSFDKHKVPNNRQKLEKNDLKIKDLKPNLLLKYLKSSPLVLQCMKKDKQTIVMKKSMFQAQVL